MELVISIPEEDFEIMKHNVAVDNPLCPLSEKDIVTIIANGTPLPKGHGRLIDANRIREEMEKDVRRAMSFVDLTDFVWLAPTIVEADKEHEKNGN